MESEPESDARKRLAANFKRGMLNRAEYETLVLAHFSLRLGECDDHHLRLFVICHNPTRDTLACNLWEEEHPNMWHLVRGLEITDESGEQDWPRIISARSHRIPVLNDEESWWIPPLSSRSFLIEAEVRGMKVEFIHPAVFGEYDLEWRAGQTCRMRFHYGYRKSNAILWTMPTEVEAAANH